MDGVMKTAAANRRKFNFTNNLLKRCFVNSSKLVVAIYMCLSIKIKYLRGNRHVDGREIGMQKKKTASLVINLQSFWSQECALDLSLKLHDLVVTLQREQS